MNTIRDRFHTVKIILVDIAIILSVVMVFDPIVHDFVFFRPHGVVAGFDENATDAYGQIDGADTPYYTTSDVNNYPSAYDLTLPYGMALDATGHRLFVTSNRNGDSMISVFQLDDDNRFVGTDRVADRFIGEPDSKTRESGSLDPAGLLQNRFTEGEIWALAYDSGTNLLYAVDRSGWRILVFDVGTTIGDITNGMDASYLIGQDAFGDYDCVDDGYPYICFPTDATHFDFGGGYVGQLLAVDSDTQRLFVADNDNDRVLVFDVSLANLASEATGADDGIIINPEYVLGKEDFETSGSQTTRDGMSLPSGVAYHDAGAQDLLFVADSNNHRVLVFDVTPGTIANGDDALYELGQEDDGTPFDSGDDCAARYGLPADDCFQFPVGVEIDDADRLFVVERDDSRVMVFDISAITDGMAAVNVLGQEDFSTNTTGPERDRFNNPHAAAYDPVSGGLFVLDSYNARVVLHEVSAIADGQDAADGVGVLDEYGEFVALIPDYPDTNARGLQYPDGIAIDYTNHRMYVADSGNNRVLMFELDTDNNPSDRTADAVLGQPTVNANIYGGPTSGSLNGPQFLAVDETGGRLFVSNSNNHEIFVYDTSDGVTTGEGAVRQLGQLDNNDNGNCFDDDTTYTTDDWTLYAPQKLAYDPTTNLLYVTDSALNRVLVFDVGTTVADIGSDCTTTTDREASYVLGQINFTDDGDNLSERGLSGPVGLSLDTVNQRLFVSEGDGGEGDVNRVLVFDVSLANLASEATGSGIAMNAVNVIGQPDFGSNNSGTSQKRFSSPRGISYDAATKLLYVADTGNSRVMVFDADPAVLIPGDAGTDFPDAIDVYGQPDFDTGGSGTTQNRFNAPYDVAHGSGLYVLDTMNNRVMVFGTAAPASSGGGSTAPEEVGFFPDQITINNDDAEVDGFNVLVNVHADFRDDFTGTIDVLLSNTPDFATAIPFRYVVANQKDRNSWPKTMAWNLCFGLPDEMCDVGKRTVYARFYVDIPGVRPAITPLVSPTPSP